MDWNDMVREHAARSGRTRRSLAREAGIDLPNLIAFLKGRRGLSVRCLSGLARTVGLELQPIDRTSGPRPVDVVEMTEGCQGDQVPAREPKPAKVEPKPFRKLDPIEWRRLSGPERLAYDRAAKVPESIISGKKAKGLYDA